MNEVDVADRIRSVMVKRGIKYPSGLSLYFQVPEQTVRTWLKGRVPHSSSVIWERLAAEELKP
jgi:hypothetical protein